MKHSIPIFWRNRDSHYRIKITKCNTCGKLAYFGRDRCPYCGSRNVTIIESKGKGTLVNFTISYYRREGDEEHLPRIVGLIKLDEGIVIPGEIVDIDLGEVKEGLRVEAVLRRYSSDDPYGLIYYGLKFIPALKK